jgi:hypothetical protein
MMTLATPETTGTVTFSFLGQDRNIYAFHSVAIDAAGNIESKSGNTIEASTGVPDLNPPVTHVLASNPSYSWGPFPSTNFSGLSPAAYNNGVFTLNWAGADPDQTSGAPAGSIAAVDIYVTIDNGSPAEIGQLNAGTPNSKGVYSGSLTYGALADNQSHTYCFYSVGVDDEGKMQPTPASPDVTFGGIAYYASLAVQSVSVEKGIAERSFIQYLDVNFNQTVSTNTALQALTTGLAGSGTGRNSFVELLWYGENLTAGSTPKGSVNLFNAGTTATVGLTGSDLSVNFGANGITSLLTETGASGTGAPTTNFGDGWYAMGIDPTGNSSNAQVFWVTFFRLFGSATGAETVSGPFTTAGTDAYTVRSAEGEIGPLLNADVDGNLAVNSKDFSDTVGAKGKTVGPTAPTSFPQFQLFAGATIAMPVNAVAITQTQIQSLLPEAMEAWQEAGLDAADVRRLATVPVEVGHLGESILGVEAAGVIMINQTAAGYNWFIGADTGSSQAFGVAGPGDETQASPGSAAADEVDLLTVLEHELGHLLGLADNTQARDLMDITLSLGLQRTPTSADVAAIAQVPNSSLTAIGARRTIANVSASPASAATGQGVGHGMTEVDLFPAEFEGQFSRATLESRSKGTMKSPALIYPNFALSPRFTFPGRRPGLGFAVSIKNSDWKHGQ